MLKSDRLIRPNTLLQTKNYHLRFCVCIQQLGGDRADSLEDPTLVPTTVYDGYEAWHHPDWSRSASHFFCTRPCDPGAVPHTAYSNQPIRWLDTRKFMPSLHRTLTLTHIPFAFARPHPAIRLLLTLSVSRRRCRDARARAHTHKHTHAHTNTHTHTHML